MKFDTRLTPATVVMALFCLLPPFLPGMSFPLYHGIAVSCVENAQALWLFFCLMFTLNFVHKTRLMAGPKLFWLWSAAWWLVLFGRSTSWGRDYFPEGPRLLFRIISVLLIAALVLPVFFSPLLRKEILYRLRNDSLLIWTFSLVVLTFLIADTVEHHRLLSFIFLRDLSYQDLTEELYEFPFMIGLFCVAWDLMQKEKHANEVIGTTPLSAS
nr:hypothetical protein [uncultured Enterobacter sp.]